jgi:protein-S-isoprenylcysteine O-methyltransferase Ste14
MSHRERVETALFHALTSLATLAWWLWIRQVPGIRPSFFGRCFDADWPYVLVFPDMVALVGGGAWVAYGIARGRPETPLLAWVHFGAAGYAWALSAVLAVCDPTAYWGFVGMSALVAPAFIVALRLSNVSILRGPFRFRTAPLLDERARHRANWRQTAAMWGLWLGIVPAALALAEHGIGWSVHWIEHPGRYVPGVLLFCAGGALATWAGNAMVRFGQGTALPSTCARELVVSGPYRWIRNPMAAGSLTQGLAVGLLIGSPAVMLYALAGIAAWEVLVRHEEEAYLRRTFGQAHAEYSARVPCWLPRFHPGR